ncbi:MAG: putative membrane protein [Candidatus Woesearchaeota archaeon]|jgi:uncharacterized membrane protein
MASKKRVTVEELHAVQKQILANQKKQLKLLDTVLTDEAKELAQEKKVAEAEAKQLAKLGDMENIQKDIRKGLSNSTLKKITYRDVTKGIVGAFFGIVGHFAFTKGKVIAATLSLQRATLLLIVAFLIIVLFMYFTGFRQIQEHLILKFMPMRALVVYFSALVTVVGVLLLYGELHFADSFTTYYTYVASIAIIAVIGACTADLIGKE